MANINTLVNKLNALKAEREQLSNEFTQKCEQAAMVAGDQEKFIEVTEELKLIHTELMALEAESHLLEMEIIEENGKIELAKIEREYKWNIFLINVGCFFRRVLHEIKWFPWLPLRLWEGWDRKKK